MGKPTGFKEFDRELPKSRDPKSRINDYKEIYEPFPEEKSKQQAARCMDCGIPFCHTGCPLGNNIPEFNDAAYRGDWKEAFEILSSTNNFPEFTGRICPAPCESSCVLGINKPPVAIELIEKTIAEKAFELNLVKPNPPKSRTGKKVAIIGSGPAGLAAAAQLNKAGHLVTVFERDDKPGGLLRYGIPDFKLEKPVLDRRLKVMEEEGIVFQNNTFVGDDIKVEELESEFDAILLAGGATVPRDLPVEGRNLNGVHFAMDFLWQQNKRVSDKKIEDTDISPKRPEYQIDREKPLSAKGKNVLVIGGGDTGSDCVGTSNRHGAKSVRQIELLEKPPLSRDPDNPWPQWPTVLRTSSSHEEGVEREWAIQTKEFLGDDNGNLTGVKVARVEWEKPAPGQRPVLHEVEGSEEVWQVELVLLAIGFLGPQKEGLIQQLGVDLDERGNVKASNFQTSKEKIFVAGDMRRGQSLVVWAISEGREAAKAIDEQLSGLSKLESKDSSYYQLQTR